MLKLPNQLIQAGMDQISQQSTVALLPWGYVWEDFLGSIGVSLETFCDQGPGGWMLGYMQALQAVGIRTLLTLISAQVDQPTRFRHAPTGATILVLPVPKSYRAIRRQMIAPYPSFCGTVEELFGNVRGVRRLAFKALHQVAPYLTIPLGLLARELKQEGCRAIICQEYEYFRFDACVLLGKLARIPVFATYQGTSFDGNLIGRRLRPLTIQACDGLMVAPQTEMQRVQHCYNLQSAKIAQIFNPIDLKSWDITGNRSQARAMFNLPNNAQVAVWHGRVELEVKGLDVLLDAWERVCSERPERNLWLALMGTGKDANKLRQRIAAMPTRNIVWIDEYITDRQVLHQFLLSGDVYVFPSRYEGFPVAPIEAMACGLPVVAAAASGVPDILAGGEVAGGLVVPCGNAAEFALALGRVLDDEIWRRDLGQSARQRVEEHFSLEAIGSQLHRFLLKSNRSIPE